MDLCHFFYSHGFQYCIYFVFVNDDCMNPLRQCIAFLICVSKHGFLNLAFFGRHTSICTSNKQYITYLKSYWDMDRICTGWNLTRLSDTCFDQVTNQVYIQEQFCFYLYFLIILGQEKKIRWTSIQQQLLKSRLFFLIWLCLLFEMTLKDVIKKNQLP